MLSSSPARFIRSVNLKVFDSQVLSGGFSPFRVVELAANVSIQTYLDRNTALRCQQQMTSRGFLEYQHAGEGIPMEEMVGIISGD